MSDPVPEASSDHLECHVDISRYDNRWYRPGNLALRFAWMMVSGLFINNHIFPFMRIKVALLRLFGAKIGKNLYLKPGVQIKYPWFLEIGDHVGIGENAWIDNLAPVTIGNHVTISQGAYLLTGNHNYNSPTFDLMLGPIVIENGVWIGARAIVCPGVTCHSHAVLGVGSIARRNLEAYGIYAGFDAQQVRRRQITPIDRLKQ